MLVFVFVDIFRVCYYDGVSYYFSLRFWGFKILFWKGVVILMGVEEVGYEMFYCWWVLEIWVIVGSSGDDDE